MRSSAVMERSASVAVDDEGGESGDEDVGETAAVEVLVVESDALICKDLSEQGRKRKE